MVANFGEYITHRSVQCGAHLEAHEQRGKLAGHVGGDQSQHEKDSGEGIGRVLFHQ